MSFGGFSFGQPAQQQPAAAASGSSLFGSTAPAAPAAGGGLFGGGTAAGNNTGSTSTFGGFGQATSTASKPAFGFGSTTNTQTPGSSLFGGQPAAITTNPAASTSLFGQPQQQQQQQQPSTSLFGQPAQNQQQQQQSSLPLFGSTSQQPTTSGSGLFGSSQPMGASTTTPSFGFGSTNQQPQQQQGLSMSQLGGPGGFGQQQQSQQLQQQPQGGAFGASTALGASTLLGQSRLGGGPRLEDLPIEQRIEYIKASWDPSSPYCRFKAFFYNLVPPSETKFYGRPANATDDAAWFKAQRDNPDPTTMVPALAVGFDDIRKRVDAQMRMAGAHWGKLQEISTRVEKLSKSSQLSLSLRLSRSQLLQTQLSHRTLLLIRHLHLLIPTLRSSSIRREEEILTQRLETLVQELDGGRGGNVRGRMMELWALVGVIKGERERDRGEGNGEGWAVVDDEAMERLAKIILDQQTALTHLTKVLKEDLAAIEIMRQGLGLVGKDPESAKR